MFFFTEASPGHSYTVQSPSPSSPWKVEIKHFYKSVTSHHYHCHSQDSTLLPLSHHLHPPHHQDNCQTLSTIFLSQLLSSTGSAIVLSMSRSSFSSVARQHNLCQHYLRFAFLSRACVSSSTVGSVSQTDHLVLLVLERIREWSVGSFVAELLLWGS